MSERGLTNPSILHHAIQPPQPPRPLRKPLHTPIISQIQFPNLHHPLPSRTNLNIPLRSFPLVQTPAAEDDFFRAELHEMARSFLAEPRVGAGYDDGFARAGGGGGGGGDEELGVEEGGEDGGEEVVGGHCCWRGGKGSRSGMGGGPVKPTEVGRTELTGGDGEVRAMSVHVEGDGSKRCTCTSGVMGVSIWR